jgi:hypothetical protein
LWGAETNGNDVRQRERDWGKEKRSKDGRRHIETERP